MMLDDMMRDGNDTRNVGHGHVRPRPDGVKARCGGPGICSACAREQAARPAAPTIAVSVGFFKSLTPEQQSAALAYRGEDA